MNRGYDWRLGKVRSIATDGKVIYDTALSKFRLSDALESAYDPFLKVRLGALLNQFDALAPSDLTLNALSDTTIKLEWVNNSLDAEGISIERSTDGITYVEIDTVLPDVITYTDTVASIVKYYYRLRAYKETSYSDYSDVAELMYGPELIVNGDFALTTGWDLLSIGVISGGKLTFTGGGGIFSTISRQTKTVASAVYKTSFVVSDRVSGNIKVYAPGVPGVVINANGTYTYENTGSAATYIFQIANDGVAFYGNFDNVSVKKKL